MHGYLGDFEVDIKDSPYKDYTPSDWAQHYITAYGGIDGSHHKTWVIDQVMRILKGTPVKLTLAKWDDGDGGKQEEYRFTTCGVEPSDDYKTWIKEGEDEGYEWDEGIAP